MFKDRIDGARRLAQLLKGRDLRDPVVLGIPRGGAVTASVLARALGAEMDVVLARKLRAPDQPELAIGAVAEDGEVYLDKATTEALAIDAEYVERERSRQLAEIERRQKIFRAARPAARLTNRSVIVTDDGIATGSTMIAALHAVRGQRPHELIVAVPVAPPTRLSEIARLCDKTVCLLTPPDFWAVGQFYRDFTPVEDEDVVALLREHALDQATKHPERPAATKPATDSASSANPSTRRAP